MPTPPALLQELRNVVGAKHVLDTLRSSRPYRAAFRLQVGSAATVVRPATLLELWKALQCCVRFRCAIILQAANTGLTGGSTPAPADYDRPVVVVSVLRIRRILLINGGKEAVCLPGSTLSQLEALLRPIGREPHSVIGSSCLGASVTGGICNNSGGALIQRGPAFSKRSLYAWVDQDFNLRLVNHLGIKLGDHPEQILEALDNSVQPRDDEISSNQESGSPAAYVSRLRDATRSEPLRYNADVSLLHESSGCAGKLAVFAVRVDTFPAESDSACIIAGTNDPEAFAEIRTLAISSLASLPISAEYLHRRALHIADRFGRDITLAVRCLGPRALARLFRIRTSLDRTLESVLGRIAWLPHALLHACLRLLPFGAPRALKRLANRFEHCLILKISARDRAQYMSLLRQISRRRQLEFSECSPRDAKAALALRFAAAGAANSCRMAKPGTFPDLVTVDVALSPKDREWSRFHPPDLSPKSHVPVAYGHYFCHVFHVDYLITRVGDADATRSALKTWFRARKAQYPAEHNFGHLYEAPAEVVSHYRQLDPTNTFNPGVGRTSRSVHWQSHDEAR